MVARSFYPTPGIGGPGWEYFKPMGTGYVKSLGPVQPTAEEEAAIADPYEHLQRQQETSLKQLEDVYAAAEESLTRNTRYKLDTLEKEYQLQVRELQNKHLGIVPEGKTAGQQLDEYQQAFDALNTQNQIAQLRIQGKVRPDLDVLNAQKEQEINQLGMSIDAKRTQLQTIDALVQDGTIQDPVAAQQAKLRTVGISLPITYFHREATPQQELQLINSLIRDTEQEIKQPFTFAGGQAIAKDVKSLMAQQEELKARKREILKTIFPQYSDVIGRTGKLGRAVTRTIAGETGERKKVGTFGTAIAEKMPQNKKLSAKEMMAKLRDTGLDKEDAIEWMKANGY